MLRKLKQALLPISGLALFTTAIVLLSDEDLSAAADQAMAHCAAATVATNAVPTFHRDGSAEEDMLVARAVAQEMVIDSGD